MSRCCTISAPTFGLGGQVTLTGIFGASDLVASVDATGVTFVDGSFLSLEGVGSTPLPAGLFDPANVYAFVHSPAGVTTPIPVQRLGVGIYQSFYTPTAVGPWIGRVSDVASPPSASSTILVDARFFVLPAAF